MATLSGSANIRVLLIETEDGWVAQCLEYDIAAQANSLQEMTDELERVLVSHVTVSLDDGREPFLGFKPAPKHFWDAYERSSLSMENIRGEISHPSPMLKVVHARQLALA